jgi:DNA-binding transcriptional LysR family regulator
MDLPTRRTNPVPPSSQTTPASGTTSDGIRRSGPSLRRKGPRIFGRRADFSPTTCARTGYGIAYLALVQVADDLRSGRLVRVLSDFPAPGVPFTWSIHRDGISRHARVL